MYRYYQVRVPQSAKDAEIERNLLLTKLKSIIQIPDETPSIATVSDKNALKKQQAFFALAENGDKVIVFPQAKKAILFRPSTNKIIESGPLLVAPNQTSTNTSNQQVTPLRVMIYNGTDDDTTVTDVDERLKKAAGPVVETTVGKANSRGYTGIMVVDITGTNKQSVEDIAKFFQGSVSALPSGETKPDADVLIIVGRSK